MNIDYTTTGTTSSDFHFRPPSPDGQEIFRRPTFDSSDLSTTSNFRTSSSVKYPQNTRKKRTKMLRLDTTNNSVSTISKPKNYGKKPDPTAPKITRPCSECGKKFLSWKALFGHMRCHPERQWRGIKPPPNFKKLEYGAGSDHSYGEDPTTRMTDEDLHVATCLLMLANGPTASCDQTPAVITSDGTTTAPVGLTDSETGGVSGFGDSDGSVRFECSGCNKVFGSHQALGGHRASHKNVKGCFTIAKSEREDEVAVQEGGGGGNQFVVVDNERNVGEGIRNLFGGSDGVGGDHHEGISNSVHQCGICFRVFSSGQALGGHKRCHIWEKLGDEHTANAGGSSLFTQGLNVGSFALASCGLDLNMPAAAAPYEGSSSASYTSCLALDLRLGL